MSSCNNVNSNRSKYRCGGEAGVKTPSRDSLTQIAPKYLGNIVANARRTKVDNVVIDAEVLQTLKSLRGPAWGQQARAGELKDVSADVLIPGVQKVEAVQLDNGTIYFKTTLKNSTHEIWYQVGDN